MLHLYSIVPLETVDEHLEDICQDIRLQYETGVANMTLINMRYSFKCDNGLISAPRICPIGFLKAIAISIANAQDTARSTKASAKHLLIMPSRQLPSS